MPVATCSSSSDATGSSAPVVDTFGLPPPSRHALERYLSRKQADAAKAAAGCLGLRAEIAIDRDRLTPGESARLTCRLWNFGPETPTEVEFSPSVRLEGAEVRALDGPTDGLADDFEVTVPADAELTTPYWLCAPHGDYSYAWAEVPHAGRPFDPPLIEVTCTLRIGGHTLELTRPALHSEFFAGGYRELEPSVLPPISVETSTNRHVLRAQGVPQTVALSVGVLAHEKKPPIVGVVEVDVPDGWAVEPARAEVSLSKAGDGDSIPVRVTVAADSPPGTHEIRYGIRCSGRLYEASISTVMQTAPGLGGKPDEGTCIRKQFIVKPAVVKVDLVDVNIHEGHSYAYVAGISDEVPALLRSLGLSVQELTDDDLTHGSLDTFDTIVVGPNAFLVRDALRKAARRLLDYTEQGGVLVVQYQGYAHEAMSAAPFPFRYHQPHDRVTMEHSPVRIVRPDHFFFHFPNRIGPDDFDRLDPRPRHVLLRRVGSVVRAVARLQRSRRGRATRWPARRQLRPRVVRVLWLHAVPAAPRGSSRPIPSVRQSARAARSAVRWRMERLREVAPSPSSTTSICIGSRTIVTERRLPG